MKKINFLKLAFTYAGCFLGAGYVSGQELWQFFASYGLWGFAGLFITVLIQFLFGVMLLNTVKDTEIYEMDKICVPFDNSVLRKIVSICAVFFMYGVYIIMAAGAGAIFFRMFGLPLAVGCGIFCLIVAFLTFYGIEGMIDLFSKVVPLLVLGTVFVCVLFLFKTKDISFDLSLNSGGGSNALLGNWFFSSLTYVSYNLFGTIGIIAPVGKITEKKDIKKGMFLGSLILFVIAFFINTVLLLNTEFSVFELPMLEVAKEIGFVFGIIYSVLLLFGMFGTSLSSFVAVIKFSEQKYDFAVKYKKQIIVILSILAFLLSLFGFGDLIGVIYPISGYFGFLVIAGTVLGYVMNRKNRM